MINIPIALTIFIFSKEILNLLFGSVFESGSTLLKFLSFYFMLGGITSIYTVLFSNIGKPKIARNISFFLVITNLILNLILIPSLGLIGAVISDVLTNFITFIYAYKKGIKILKWHPPYKLTLFILIFSFVFFIFPFIIKIFFNINTIFKIMLSLFISFIFYTFLLFRFKIISKKEINFFFIFLRKE